MAVEIKVHCDGRGCSVWREIEEDTETTIKEIYKLAVEKLGENGNINEGE